MALMAPSTKDPTASPIFPAIATNKSAPNSKNFLNPGTSQSNPRISDNAINSVSTNSSPCAATTPMAANTDTAAIFVNISDMDSIKVVNNLTFASAF